MNTKKLVLLGAAAMLMGVGCSSKKSSDSSAATGSTEVKLSGSLALSGSSGSLSKVTPISKPVGIRSYDSKVGALADSAYRIACATFETVPKACGGAVATTGAFDVTCDGFAGVPFGCYVFHTTSFKNFPITFNVNAGEEKSSMKVSGATSLSNVEIVLDTDTGLAAAEVTIADTTAVTEVTVDASALSNIDGTWALSAKTYAEAGSKYSTDDFTSIKKMMCQKSYWQTCTGPQSGCSPEAQQTYCSNSANLTWSDEAAYNAMMQERIGGGNFAIYMKSFTEDSKNYIGVWPSAASRAICGDIETGFTWKFSDGTGGKDDVALDFTTATGCNAGEKGNECLMRKLGTSVNTVIDQWFPMLKGDLEESAPTVTASCKVIYNLHGDIWNPPFEAQQKCNDTDAPACSALSGDPVSKVRSYIMKKIYEGATDVATDKVLKELNLQTPGGPNTQPAAETTFADNVVDATTATTGYGYRTWNNGTETWVTLANPQRVDLGGCLQWPDWSKCKAGGDCSSLKPEIVKVGSNVKQYGQNPDSSTDDREWKCGFSDKRLLVEDATNGYITLNNVKYREAQSYVEVDSVKYESWSKVCDVAFTKDSQTMHNYQTYPLDFDATKIATEASGRASGGTPEQKRGMYMQAIYEQISSGNKGGGGGGDHGPSDFHYGSGSVTCSAIRAGTASWANVEKAFENNMGPWQLGGLLKCAMVGVYNNRNGAYSAQATQLNSISAGIVDSFAPYCASHGGCSGNNADYTPLVFKNLAASSCIPQFQMTHACNSEGYCSPKVICDDFQAEDGGCSNGANPASRMARMKVEALADGKFQFLEKNNRYDIRFDPSSNSSTTCQRTEYMTITTDDALTSGITSVGMTFDSRESEVNITSSDLDCNGKELDDSKKDKSGSMKMYTTFTKQQNCKS